MEAIALPVFLTRGKQNSVLLNNLALQRRAAECLRQSIQCLKPSMKGGNSGRNVKEWSTTLLMSKDGVCVNHRRAEKHWSFSCVRTENVPFLVSSAAL